MLRNLVCWCACVFIFQLLSSAFVSSSAPRLSSAPGVSTHFLYHFSWVSSCADTNRAAARVCLAGVVRRFVVRLWPNAFVTKFEPEIMFPAPEIQSSKRAPVARAVVWRAAAAAHSDLSRAHARL